MASSITCDISELIAGAGLGVASLLKIAELFVAKNGSFLVKEFLSNELSGRKIELGEVVEPLLQPESDATQKDVFCGAYVC